MIRFLNRSAAILKVINIFLHKAILLFQIVQYIMSIFNEQWFFFRLSNLLFLLFGLPVDLLFFLQLLRGQRQILLITRVPVLIHNDNLLTCRCGFRYLPHSDLLVVTIHTYEWLISQFTLSFLVVSLYYSFHEVFVISFTSEILVSDSWCGISCGWVILIHHNWISTTHAIVHLGFSTSKGIRLKLCLSYM